MTQAKEGAALWVRGAEVYAPEPLGRKDVLAVHGRITAIADRLPPPPAWLPGEEIDGRGLRLAPGLIDGHVHILGGGGEGGPTTRAPEVTVEALVTGGITTIVGLLGFDSVTRSVISLLAKARALQEEGVSAWIYTGSYQVPPRTVTGDVETDIVLIREVVGVGEIAIADQRASQADLGEIVRLAARARIGGFLANKSGRVHLHVGDGPAGLEPLVEAVARTDLPLSQFYPTHVNRQPRLLEQAAELARQGVPVDVTASATPELDAPDAVPPDEAVRRLLDSGVDPGLVTMSSDGNGSLPAFDEHGDLVSVEVGSVHILWEKLRRTVTRAGVPLETALRLATENVAQILKLPGKGRVAPGMDADFILLDDDLRLRTVIAGGRVAARDGKPLLHGPFEARARADARRPST